MASARAIQSGDVQLGWHHQVLGLGVRQQSMRRRRMCFFLSFSLVVALLWWNGWRSLQCDEKLAVSLATYGCSFEAPFPGKLASMSHLMLEQHSTVRGLGLTY